MTSSNGDGMSRRGAIAAGLAGAAGLASARGLATTGDVESADERERTPRTSRRMPVVFLPHGGGPWPFVEMGLDEEDVAKLSGYLRSLRTIITPPPRAVLIVSAHWEERVPTLMTAARPPLLYDYYGFPAASYQITWPAPGEPALAARVGELLGVAGFTAGADASRGFDHGTFIPLKVTFPDADVPTVQLSLLSSLDPAEHLRLGRALAPLRDEGVLIVGSGMSFHNLRMFRDRARAHEISESFDRWLRETVALEQDERDRRLVEWPSAPSARAAHPREEHLLPLHVASGAAGSDRGVVAFSEPFMGARISAVHYGV